MIGFHGDSGMGIRFHGSSGPEQTQQPKTSDEEKETHVGKSRFAAGAVEITERLHCPQELFVKNFTSYFKPLNISRLLVSWNANIPAARPPGSGGDIRAGRSHRSAAFSI